MRPTKQHEHADMPPLNRPATSSLAPPDDFAKIEEDQEEFKATFAKLMDQSSPPVLHVKTSVLLLYWHEYCTNLKTESEVFALRDVFENLYGFEVITQALDTETVPETQAFDHLSSFVRPRDMKDGLFLVYYAGHGFTESPRPGSIMLTGRDETTDDSTTIEWGNVEMILKKAQSDVLEIFDCCFAGHLCKPASRNPSRCSEILAACRDNQMTPAPGDTSFTSAMIWALTALARTGGFHTYELLQKIREAPHFKKDQEPQLYRARFKQSERLLYIAPRLKTPTDGIYRSDINSNDARQEMLLDLRFHFDGHILDDDLLGMTDALKNAMNTNKLRAHRVSAIGRYNHLTYDRTVRKRNLTESTVGHWRKQTKNAKRSSASTRTSESEPTPKVSSDLHSNCSAHELQPRIDADRPLQSSPPPRRASSG